MNQKLFLAGIFVALPLLALGQLMPYPITQGTTDSQAAARTKSLTPMKLPFWDDFASTVNTDTLWEYRSSIWFNNGMGIDPPSIGVATFDGLNGDGVPYSPNPNQNLDFGFTDSLESRRIRMADVPVFERNSVFLSFYYQWGGFGEVPDQNDFLRLELLDNTGKWESVLTLQSGGVQQPNQFYSTTLRINQDRFFHNDFRFRFRSSGRKSGRYDTWNIDYVYLNKGRTDTDLSQGFPDRTPYRMLNALFSPYYAIPMRHYVTDPVGTTGFPSFGISNLSNIPQPMNYDIDAQVTSFTGGTPSTQSFTVATAQPILPSVQAFQKREITFTVKPDFSSYTSADSLVAILKTTLVTGDSVNTGFEPLNFLINDTLRHAYAIKDYYAYDDGTAEYAAGLTQAGNMVAYRYINKSGTPDTLNGVYIHYPITAGTSATTVTVLVWSNANGLPHQVLLEELVPVQRSSNNTFVQRTFIQSAIVADTFYIGWRQTSAGRVQVGLDASQDTGNRMFVNVSGGWTQNTLVKGSLMIRPRFGKGEIITSVEESPDVHIAVYPNPGNGTFTLTGDVDILGMINTSGSLVPIEIEKNEAGIQVRMKSPVAGLYLLRCRSGNKIITEKVLVIP